MKNNRLALDNQCVPTENFEGSFSIKRKEPQPNIKHAQFINLRDYV